MDGKNNTNNFNIEEKYIISSSILLFIFHVFHE